MGRMTVELALGETNSEMVQAGELPKPKNMEYY